MNFDYDWLIEQVDSLSGSCSGLDKEALQAYLIMEMGNQIAALKSRTRVLLIHLLKWQYQEEKRTNSWRSTIREQRRKISDLIGASSNLKNKFPEIAMEVYPSAREDASDETGILISSFPEEMQFLIKSLLDINWLPGE